MCGEFRSPTSRLSPRRAFGAFLEKALREVARSFGNRNSAPCADRCSVDRESSSSFEIGSLRAPTLGRRTRRRLRQPIPSLATTSLAANLETPLTRVEPRALRRLSLRFGPAGSRKGPGENLSPGQMSKFVGAKRTTREAPAERSGAKFGGESGMARALACTAIPQGHRLACANLQGRAFGWYGGESGIRTLGTVSRTHAFQACSLSHSDNSPRVAG